MRLIEDVRRASPEEVVGRDAELAAIGSFLEDGPGSVLLLEGEAGAGKTTLVRAAVALASGRGRRVLHATPSERERQLAYATLTDLLGAAVGDVADELAPPRRVALEVALMLAAPTGDPPDPLAVALATGDLLQALAARSPLLVAVDDVQWVDTASADALAFALRRLRGRSALALLARRAPASAPPLGLQHEDVRTLPVGPLSIGAVHRLLVERLGRSFQRPLLHRLHEGSGGNPFFVLELARALERRGGSVEPGQPLPVPPTLVELVREHLDSLPADTRLAVAAAALARSPVASALGDALAPALAAGVVEVERDAVRFTHPLLLASARELPAPDERRAIHASLAHHVSDPEERARHLALSSEGPDEAVAAVLEEAARSATARGARADAAELLELAAALTPDVGSGVHVRRRLGAASELIAAGAWARARAQLEEFAVELEAGRDRAEVLFLLGTLREDDLLQAHGLYEQALAEAEADPRLAARISTELANLLLNFGDLALSRVRLHEAIERFDDPRALAYAILLDTLCGTPSDERLVVRALAWERDTSLTWQYSPSLALGLVRMYADRLDEARELIVRGIELAGKRVGGDALWLHLAELECRAGRLPEAEAAAARALEFAEQVAVAHALSYSLYASALVDTHLGRADDARRKAERAVELARASNDWVFEIQGLATLGFLELSLGRPAEAAAVLKPVAERLQAAGAREPSVWVGALPNAIEALIALGELDQARAFLSTLDDQAATLEGSWARARAARCHGLLAAAEGRFVDAFAALERACAEPEVPLERGRTLLALGLARRRAKQKRPAREAFTAALGVFEDLGAVLWVERTREELGRVAGRRASPSDLSATERRVADLVAAGRTNKQVAAELFLSVKAVEANLSRVYRKLGVRSRTELAARRKT